MRMQAALTKIGLASVSADGDFGPKTEAALKDWQRSRKLVVDGICGAQSWSLLLEDKA
jgi:peptidoglycan hydrolase-like protein with peptidoglycan-binding domain